MTTRTRLLSSAALLLALGVALVAAPGLVPGRAQTYIALIKLAALAVAAAAAAQSAWRERQASWWVLTVGLVLYACGQSVLAYHQVVLDDLMPFPSLGDPFFVASYAFLVGALVHFGREALASGLPVGRPLVFWSPAVVVFLVLAGVALPIIRPILRAGGAPTEVFLNVFYPVASFLLLAPAAVMLRVAVLFRGGRLLWTWLPITVGFATVALSDILYAYVTLLDVAALEQLMDFLYYFAYVSLAHGVVHHWVLTRAEEPAGASS